MKKADLYILAQAGVSQISSHTIPAAHAYKVVKFRKALAAALEALGDEGQAINKEAGIEDAEAFDKRRRELTEKQARTAAEQKELETMKEKADRLFEMRKNLYDEPVLLNCKTMPFDVWRELQRENAEKEINGRKCDILSGRVEDLLEDVLWTAPSDDAPATQDTDK